MTESRGTTCRGSAIMSIELTESQREARDAIVAVIASGSSRSVVLGGAAGTGKTTVIQAIASAVRGEVAVMAYTGKAVDVLMSKGVEARTMHSTLYSCTKNNDGSLSFTPRRRDSITASAFIIDEASMVPFDMYNHVRSFGLPTIFVGDHFQLPPVRGDFNIMKNPDIVLDTPHRFSSGVAKFAHYVRTSDAVDPAVGFDGVDVLARGGDVLTDNLDISAVRSADVVLVHSNKERCRYNRLIRQVIQGKDRYPVVGDRITFLANNYTLRVKNGQQGVIETISGSCMVISVDGGSRVTVTAVPRFYEECPDGGSYSKGGSVPVDYAYALTVHKAQGSEWESVTVVDPAPYSRARMADDGMLQRWRYTAVTRAKSKIKYIL